MKIGSQILILLLALCLNGWAQGFINLDFESAIIQTNLGTTFYLDPAKAIPGWTAYLNGNPQNVIDLDGITLGGAMVSLQDTNATFEGTVIQGNYSVLLLSSTAGTQTSASIGQTGTIPITAETLSFWGQNVGGMLITFNGQPLSFMAISNTLNYTTIYGADISTYAGQTGQLLFTGSGTNPFAGGGVIDNIQFSSLPIPEPSVFALAVLGALTLGFQYRRIRPR